MFNEILTGKASLENPPPAAQPSQPAPLPPPVFIPTPSYAAMEAEIDRRRRSHTILYSALAVAVGLGVWLFEAAWQHAADEEARELNRGYQKIDTTYYDPFVTQAREHASNMCACHDKQCAWSVQGTFNRWSRTARPTGEAAADAATEHIDRYTDCLAKLTN